MQQLIFLPNDWWYRLVWVTSGAANLKELHDNAQFIEMSGAGLKESHPHDVQIIMRHQTTLCKKQKKEP